MQATLLFAICLSAAAASALADSPNPYAGQETRAIKAMPAEDVQSYLKGKGMGLAKTAELNAYPGPSHVLALAPRLGLTDEQQKLTKAAFATMEAQAIKLGGQLVDEERKLDQLFASRQITSALLNASLGRIGALQAQVRAAHLEAHLAQVRILTPQQSARYSELRGYTSAQPAALQHAH